MTDWSYEGLWQKAKLYVQRAASEHRDSSMFPFWSALALEFLGRATLAKVHPALLADPLHGDNVLHACGYPSTTKPRSVPAKTVFLRCQHIIENFTISEFNIAMSIIDRRNQELHTGSPAFEDFPTHLWLADYYRVCIVLLKFQRRSPASLFGNDEASAAQNMIRETDAKAKGQAREDINRNKKAFLFLDENTREERRIHGSLLIQTRASSLDKIIPCPSCDSKALMKGKRVRTSEPRPKEDGIDVEIAVLPTSIICFCCGLKLRGHGVLHSVKIGGQYSVIEHYDPADYYGIEFDPADYIEAEYMNE